MEKPEGVGGLGRMHLREGAEPIPEGEGEGRHLAQGKAIWEAPCIDIEAWVRLAEPRKRSCRREAVLVVWLVCGK